MWRMIGCSSTMPAAPMMSRASRAVSSAICTLFILAIEICWGRTLPSSFKRPSWSARSWALVISVIIHTSFCCTSGNEPMGLPNCTRCCAYCSAQSYQPMAERPAQPLHVGELVLERDAAVLERQLRGDRRPHRELAVDVEGRKARSAALDQVAADLPVVPLGPHHR